jgi:hypothetical protein
MAERTLHDLPNEVLRIVVSYVPDTHNTFRDVNGTITNLIIESPFFALMSVSRRFRMIALEDYRWFDQDFRFERLVTWRPSLPANRHHTMKFVQALLDNEHLRDFLSRKTHWTITGFDLFSLLVINLPEFLRTVRAVTLDVGLATESMIDRLSLIHQLTELYLPRPNYTVDLEAIDSACPMLENLHLGRMDLFTSPLNSMANLRKLRIDGIPEFPFADGLIPHDSAATLTSLTLMEFHRIEEDLLDGPGFSEFRHLTHLEICPIHNDFWEIMPAIPSQLSTFKVMVEISEESFEQMNLYLFTAGCFKRLREFHLTFGDDNNWPWRTSVSQSYRKDIVNGIGSDLLMLTHLKLGMCVLPSWCKMLWRLTSLEQLTLILNNKDLKCMGSGEGLGEGERSPTSDGSDGIVSPTVPHIRKILASAFESVHLRPAIYIEAR